MVAEKIVVDAAELTLEEHAEAAEVAAKRNGAGADGPGAQFYSVAAMAWLVHRRVDPTFTYEQALRLKMGDLDLVAADPPEVPAASNGGAPALSPEYGTSTRQT